MKKVKLGDIILFNPSESIKKGNVAKKIPMEKLLPHTKKISGFENAIYSSGPKFRNGDTLLAKITPCLENGKTAFVDILDENEVAFGSSEFIVLRAIKNVTDTNYIHYLARSPKFRSRAIGCMEGTSGRKRVNDKTLQDEEFYLPDLPTQTAIARILSSLDNKIELNNKINKELENLARIIYEYWFVQNAEEKWERKKIGEIAEVINGATPSTNDKSNYEGEIVWITPKDLSVQQNKFTYYGERSITEKGYNSCNTTLVPINSILLSSRAPIGLLSIAKVELCTNQGFKVLVPFDEKMSSYLYYYLLNQIEVIQHLGAGTTFKEVSKNTLLEFSVVCPTSDILEKWGNFINSIFDKQFVIAKENVELSRLRDFLLPLLMNGQVASTSLSHRVCNRSLSGVETSGVETSGVEAAETTCNTKKIIEP